MNTASRVATGVAGIAAVVLLFAGQFVGAIGSRTEPAFDSSTQEIVAFLHSLRSGPQTAGTVIVLVGTVAFLTFAAGLRDVLAPAGEGLSVLAVRTAQLCTVALVVAVMGGEWEDHPCSSPTIAGDTGSSRHHHLSQLVSPACRVSGRQTVEVRDRRPTVLGDPRRA
jgi:hypothetical protein